jgi:two-component system cell cycle sensor histidine kinase/response regulator CckA
MDEVSLSDAPEQPETRQTVLVVDGEEIVRKTITFIFEHRMGFRVVGASDGAQARALFASHAAELALIVVEVALPRVSGAEFVTHLPTLEPRIPVLFITAMGEYELPETVTRHFPVLRKPFKADTLVTAAKHLIPQD